MTALLFSFAFGMDFVSFSCLFALNRSSSTISNERGPGQSSLGKSLASQIEIVGKGRGAASKEEQNLPP